MGNNSRVSPSNGIALIRGPWPFIKRVTHNGPFYCALAVIFAVLSFLPEFIQGTLYTSIIQTDDADDYYIVGFDNDPFFRQACISGLIISLPSGLDMLLDFVTYVANMLLFKGEAPMVLPRTTNLNCAASFCMTYLEKFLFILGLICLAAICFDPVRSYWAPATMYASFLNASTVLTICPILQLLSRCAPTWKPLICIAIGSLVCLGGLISSITFFTDPKSLEFRELSHASNIMFIIASALFLITCGMSLVNTYWKSVKYPDDKASKTPDSNRDHCNRLASRERFRNCVIAAHSTSVAIMMVLNVVWYWYGSALDAYTLGIFIYLTVAASSVVFIAEFRVRKHETAQALLALLDSKKQYVRYISHELRTPMNAASLGLQYLTDRQLPDDATPEEIDTYETLIGVQTACNTAVEILNDILCFEKLESGMLELHKSHVSAVEYIKDCVKLFGAQAKERDITLCCNMYNRTSRNGNENESERSALLPSDTIHVDKFKMDQVLRNLISNAIKFSPRGGVVTVQGRFVSSASSGVPTSSRHRRRSGIILMHHVGTLLARTVNSVRFIDKNKRKNWDKSGGENKGESNKLDSGKHGANDEDKKNEKEKEIERTPKRKRKWSLKESIASHILASRKRAFNAVDGKCYGHLEVTVTDTGAGISHENQQRLFKDVVQFNPEILQAGGGSGFGLFISKGIVDLHGGEISVHSEGEGMGSSFTVKIPMTREVVDSLRNNNEKLEVVCAGVGDGNGKLERKQESKQVVGEGEVVRAVEGAGEMGLGRMRAHGRGRGERRRSRSWGGEGRVGRLVAAFTRSKASADAAESAFSLPHLASSYIEGYQPKLRPRPSASARAGVSAGMGTGAGARAAVGAGVVEGKCGFMNKDKGTNIAADATNNIGNDIFRRRSTQSSTNRRSRSRAKSEDVGIKGLDLKDEDKAEEDAVEEEEVEMVNPETKPCNQRDEPCSKPLSGNKCTTNETNADRDGMTAGTRRVRDVCSGLWDEQHTQSQAEGQARSQVRNGNGNGSGGEVVKSASSMYRLLVVDDSTLSRKMLLKVLRSAGHICDEAEDGQVAVEKVKKVLATSGSSGGFAPAATYDAILMDFMMPIMDGPTATKEIRSLGFTAQIFGVTGNGLASDIAHFKSCGANEVIVKPFEMKVFCRLMDPNSSTIATPQVR